MRPFQKTSLILVALVLDQSFAESYKRQSFVPRRSDVATIVESIPRGGALPISIDQQTVATAALSCMLGQRIWGITEPSKAIAVYGLDTKQPINSFYFTRISGLSLTTVGSLLLQLYRNVPFEKSIGYSFLPITALTLYQLFTGKYEQAGVKQNSGIVDVFFQTLHCVIMLVGAKVPPFAMKLWIQTYMAVIGLSGLNLVVSAQTIPGIGPSTVTILRMLGTVSCYVATCTFAQNSFGMVPLKAFGVMMATLALTSLPVCMDLRAVAKKSNPSTNNPLPLSVQLYIVYMLLEIGVAAYMFR